MTHEEAFFQAILESPDDDRPRLAWADWLEETGQRERAEFIRVQCQLACFEEEGPEEEALRARQQALLADHEFEWAGPLRGLVEKWQFRRGFIEFIQTRAGDFMTHAATILSLAPVRQVDLCGGWLPVDATLARLDACDELTRLRAVDLTFGYREIGDQMLRTLASSPRLLERLDCLHLVSGRFCEAELAPVLSSPCLRRLRSLWLTSCGVCGEPGVRALLESRQLGSLGDLALRDNPLGAEGVQALVDSPNCGSLAALDLSRSRVGPAGAAAIGRSPQLGELICLFLGGNAIGDEGASALAGSPRLAGLECLGLARNGITDAGALALAQSPSLDRLEMLRL